jgi:hypothetical protein
MSFDNQTHLVDKNIPPQILLVDKNTPPPGLIYYANEVNKLVNSGDFQNNLLGILGSNKNILMIKNGGRKSNRRLIRRSTLKRQNGGEKSMFIQLLVGIFVGTAMMRIGQVEFGQVMEWVRTNPQFYYTSVFSVILAKFPGFTRELYVKAVTKQLIGMISSDLFFIGSITKLYNILTFGPGNKEDAKECLLQIEGRFERSQTNIFKFENDTLGTVTVDLKCPLSC